ncbi:MAG TPA: COX15/CtaA family protein [Acidimicrobiales bacterium]|nr:COX15/CtaA family protein [Acidimicrobiales bacterium]
MPSLTSRRVTGPVFRWFALATFLSMIVIVLTGAAVRLTGSGLGCPDWPTCFHDRLTGSWSIHPLIEYGNRMVTIALVVLVGAAFAAALLRERRRVDLVVLSGALVLGIVADAVLGAFVVYSKLNPYLVSLHMLLSLAMVAIAATLYHHSKYVYGPDARADVRDPYFRGVARALWIPFFVLVLTGTATTGSGPHAGASQGQLVARRLPFALSSAAWVHSLAAVLFIGLVTGVLVAIWKSDAPTALKLGVRRLVYIALVQGAIGATQYLTHLPAWLVELHVAGAISLTIGLTQFNLRQIAHDREPGTKKRPA